MQQFGVSSQRAPWGLRIVVPPLPSWRHLPKGYFIAIAVLGFLTVFPLAEAIGLRQSDPVFVIPAVEFGIPTLVVAWYAACLVRRRVVIDVTRDDLAITLVRAGGGGRRMSWRRGDHPSVGVSEVTGKLLVRCTGMDIKEVYVGSSQAVLNAVVAAVNEALVVDLAPADQGGFPPVVRAGERSRRADDELLWFFVLLILIGAVCLMFWWPPAGILLFVVVIALFIPYAGMTRGTQDKEFFT